MSGDVNADIVVVFRLGFAPDGSIETVREELPRAEVLRLLMGTSQRTPMKDPRMKVLALADPDITMRFVNAARARG